jgi:hypothetical protein
MEITLDIAFKVTFKVASIVVKYYGAVTSSRGHVLTVVAVPGGFVN